MAHQVERDAGVALLEDGAEAIPAPLGVPAADIDDERAMLRDCVETIESATGRRPLGWLGPAALARWKSVHRVQQAGYSADVVVVGAGTAGLVTAAGAEKLTISVTAPNIPSVMTSATPMIFISGERRSWAIIAEKSACSLLAFSSSRDCHWSRVFCSARSAVAARMRSSSSRDSRRGWCLGTDGRS